MAQALGVTIRDDRRSNGITQSETGRRCSRFGQQGKRYHDRLEVSLLGPLRFPYGFVELLVGKPVDASSFSHCEMGQKAGGEKSRWIEIAGSRNNKAVVAASLPPRRRRRIQ